MDNSTFHRNLRFGFVLHGNKLWLSEFLGFAFIGIIFCAFISISIVMLRNSMTINHQGKTIAALRENKVELAWEIEKLRAQDRLVQSLRAIIGYRVPADQVYHLVNLVYLNSKNYGYDPLLVLAVIHVESVFDLGANGQFRSGALSGAMGLMQLKFETAQGVAHDLGIRLEKREDLLRPEINIQLGIAYLTRQIAMFKSFKLGLMAYNQGPGAVIQNLTENKPLQVEYFNKILKSYFRFKSISDAQ